MAQRITSPLTEEMVEKLRAGDQVLISGVLYSARDAAHKRLIEALDKGEKLPLDIRGQTIYYLGPSPTKPGKITIKGKPASEKKKTVKV